jgi:hypothetical protein
VDKACLCAYQEPYYQQKSLNLEKEPDMAKWVLSTPPPFTGTKHGVTVYQLPDGKWYVRMKSSITGERIKVDPVFKAFRKSSGRMREASPIASFVYQQLEVKSYPLYREMTGKAMLWLKEGIPAAVVQDRLIREYLHPEKPCTSIKKLPSRPMPRKMYRLTGRRTISVLPERDYIVTSERVMVCSIPFFYSYRHTVF